MEPTSIKVRVSDPYSNQIFWVRPGEYQSFLKTAQSSRTLGELRTELRFGS